MVLEIIVSNQIIYNNGTSGVFVQSGNNNSILNNSIYDNTSLGIKLAAGTNDSQNYPILNTMYTWQDENALPEIKGGTAISGTLNSTPDNYKIQFFANSSTSSTREGKRFLGEIELTVDDFDITGNADFLANLKDAVLPELDGEVISATATKLDIGGNPLSTSEFSFSIERATDEGDHYLVNTTLAGIPLHWQDGNGDYQVANSVVSLSYDDEIQNGFNTWSSLEQINYTRNYYPNSEVWGGNADGINNIVWIPTTSEWETITEAPTNVVAITRTRYNALNGEMIDIDIAFNGDPVSLVTGEHYYWDTAGDPDALDVQNVITHEIGHYSGLADLYNPGDFSYVLKMKNNNQLATMYGRIANGETYKNSFHPDIFANQMDVTKYDIGGINYIYDNLGDVYYDIVLVFDGTNNFTSPGALNGFAPSQSAAMELVYKLRLGDNVGWVNGSVTENLGNDFTSKLNALNSLQPNGSGNLAQRILAAEQLFSSSSPNKKVIILFSAGQVSPFSLITNLNIDPDIRIFTMGFEGLNESQDLMSWLADETGGEYYDNGKHY